MNYLAESKAVISQFKEGRLLKEDALKMLADIEDRAYQADPHAEPDGDITYAVASAIEEIDP